RTHMEDRRTVRHPEALRSQLERIIIRNRRGPETVELVPRHVHFFHLDPLPAEAAFYQNLSQSFSRGNRELGDPIQVALTRILLLREACSSGKACAVTLHRLAQRSTHDDAANQYTALMTQALALEEQ